MWGRAPETDSGWVGAGAEDDLDRRLAEEPDAPAPGQPFVATLLGPIAPAALGATLSGERLARLLATAEGADDPDVPLALLAELEDAYAAGVRALLALDPPGKHRPVAALRWLAGRSPLHLVAATGPRSGLARQGQTAAMIEDLTVGMAGTPGRAGAIALPLAADGASDLLPAVAAAQIATGAAVCLLAPGIAPALDALAKLAAAGVDPGRCAVHGVAARSARDELRQLLRTGASLAFDQTLAAGRDGAGEQARTIAALVGEGFGCRLLLASGLARRPELRGHGGEPGWGALVERFPLLLMETGLDAPAVRALLVDNPRRLLTIGGEGDGGG